jgi:hypothetical protein
MKKMFLFFITIISVSCDNGDFIIPSFTFSETVNSCGTYVVYRTNSDKTEALILQLNTTLIQNAVTTSSPRTLNITESNTQYRIFDGAIESNYFCQSVPPTSPNTIKTWTGITGTDSYIYVTTEKVFNANDVLTGYKHIINIHNLRLINGEETITYENYYFGVFITSI